MGNAWTRKRRALAVATGLAAAALLATGAARAAAPAGGAATPATPWLAVGLLAGSTQPDRRLADYQWDVSPGMAWGVRALAGTDRRAVGLRLWSTGTTQSMGSSRADVRITSWELLGQGRLGVAWGTQVSVVAGGGLLHLVYRPDQVTFAPSGSGAPIVVDLDAVSTWVASGGLALRHPLARGWNAGLEVEHRLFELETAHRNGDTIERRRERFGDWSARLELARHWGWPTRGTS